MKGNLPAWGFKDFQDLGMLNYRFNNKTINATTFWRVFQNKHLSRRKINEGNTISILGFILLVLFYSEYLTFVLNHLLPLVYQRFRNASEKRYRFPELLTCTIYWVLCLFTVYTVPVCSRLWLLVPLMSKFFAGLIRIHKCWYVEIKENPLLIFHSNFFSR